MKRRKSANREGSSSSDDGRRIQEAVVSVDPEQSEYFFKRSRKLQNKDCDNIAERLATKLDSEIVWEPSPSSVIAEEKKGDSVSGIKLLAGDSVPVVSDQPSAGTQSRRVSRKKGNSDSSDEESKIQDSVVTSEWVFQQAKKKPINPKPAETDINR